MTQVARCNTPRRASEVASIVQVDERSRRTRMPIADFRHPAAVGAPSAGVGFKQSRRRARLCPVCGDNRRNPGRRQFRRRARIERKYTP
jgi:hypothetical protein